MTKLEREFRIFHMDNPWVYDSLVEYARQAKGAGFEQYSMNGLFERLRWHLNVETSSKDGFKLNNNHRSFYSREIMQKESDLDEFFEVREQPSQQFV